jgi:hypothetical protein
MEMLQEEILKINNELYELEKKYGEVKIVRIHDLIQA